MVGWIYQEETQSSYQVKDSPRVPECGKDFCDSCGDCLACYGPDPCTQSSDGEHLWVDYLES